MEERKYSVKELDILLDMFMEECDIVEKVAIRDLKDWIKEQTPKPQNHIVVKKGMASFIYLDVKDIPSKLIEDCDSITTIEYKNI